MSKWEVDIFTVKELLKLFSSILRIISEWISPDPVMTSIHISYFLDATRYVNKMHGRSSLFRFTYSENLSTSIRNDF